MEEKRRICCPYCGKKPARREAETQARGMYRWQRIGRKTPTELMSLGGEGR